MVRSRSKYKHLQTKDLEYLLSLVNILPSINVVQLCNELLTRETKIPKEDIENIKRSSIAVSSDQEKRALLNE